MKNTVSLAPLITESERVLAEAIKHFGLKTKPSNIVLTIQTKGQRNAIGWFWPGRWKAKTGTEAIHEINLSAEYLRDHNMGETLLHELAHAENQTLGIKDCSNQVHNKKFKTMAERLGLQVKPRDKSYGYGFTDLDAPAIEFLKKIKFDKELFDMNRFGGLRSVVKGGTRLLKACCHTCGYTVRVTQKWVDVGMPTCPCGEEMELD